MISGNVSSLLLEDPSTMISIIAIVISIISAAITFYYNKRIADANEHMYKLAYEQDLLMRKEKHFNELKKNVIEPLLCIDKLFNLNLFFFVDLIRHHYPELGSEMRKLAKMFHNRIDIENKIVELSFTIIKVSGYKDSIKFDINDKLLHKKVSELLYIVKKHPQVNKYVEIKLQKKDNTTYYSLYLFSMEVYKNEERDLVNKAKKHLLTP